MPSFDAYEQHLPARLEELRRVDRAYELHQDVALDAIVLADRVAGSADVPRRVLDVGCGLGFLAARLGEVLEDDAVVGIDPSAAAIELAKQEHSGVNFYAASAQEFADTMPELGEAPFTHGVLNMVLHSVDDDTATAILKGVKRCLEPGGALAVIVPTRTWLLDKLVEYARGQGARRKPGIKWMSRVMMREQVDLPVKIRDGQYYGPITVYNRTLDDYGKLLEAAGFGVGVSRYDVDGNLVGSAVKPYLVHSEAPVGNIVSYDIHARLREALCTFVLPEPEVVAEVLQSRPQSSADILLR